MQVPEKLALIGGSILLSSTLIFTLKSQASSIIPHVGHSISNVYQDITNTNAEHGGMPFTDAFKNAQQQGWQTGQWGTSKYYIDTNQNMHIGKGQLDKPIYDVLGNEGVRKLKAITLDESIQAPADSSNLFAGRNYNLFPNDDPNTSIVAINGLDKLDTSHVTNMTDMFYNDTQLSGTFALNDWNTSHVQNMRGIFGKTSLSNFDISHFDTSQVQDISWAFFYDSRIQNLDLSGWQVSNTKGTKDMLGGTDNLGSLDLADLNIAGSQTDYLFGGSYVSDSNVHEFTIGAGARLDSRASLPNAKWKNGNTVLSSGQLEDGNSHPGTWAKQ